MPITSVEKNLDDLTITIVADFAAPLARLWDAYADPRQIERFWGPPTYPATFLRHDVAVGGRSVYRMTGPEGEKYYGYWEIDAVDQPNSFTFRDGFAIDETFAKNEDLPESQNVYSFADNNGATRATWVGIYASAEALQQVLDMGMVEGATEAINQIDTLLAS